mgnify:CR=1 FL=1
MAKRIDVGRLEAVVGTLYPPPLDEPCRARARTRLGDPAGLTQFGVNLLRLPPGQWSSQRHWQHGEDEFVYVLEGEVVMVTDAGTRWPLVLFWTGFGIAIVSLAQYGLKARREMAT